MREIVFGRGECLDVHLLTEVRAVKVIGLWRTVKSPWCSFVFGDWREVGVERGWWWPQACDVSCWLLACLFEYVGRCLLDWYVACLLV